MLASIFDLPSSSGSVILLSIFFGLDPFSPSRALPSSGALLFCACKYLSYFSPSRHLVSEHHPRCFLHTHMILPSPFPDASPPCPPSQPLPSLAATNSRKPPPRSSAPHRPLRRGKRSAALPAAARGASKSPPRNEPQTSSQATSAMSAISAMSASSNIPPCILFSGVSFLIIF